MAEVTNPVKMTDEVVKKLEEAFAIDASISEACFYANITRQTYYNWIKSFPEYEERFDSLRQRPVLKARQTVVKSLDNPDFAFKYLERKKKKEFGNSVDVTSGNNPIPILGTYVRTDNSNNQDNKDVQADTSSVGGNVSEQDGINSLIPDPPCTDGQNTNAN